MCGLAGYANLNFNLPIINPALLERMQQKIAHRGPNGYRLWISPDNSIGLAHRRLSILDLSDAAFQPLSNQEKTIWVCCNGEIYNHPQLRHELEQLGYRYQCNSDTESIVHAYQEWGIKAFDRLEGMFAIIIVDLRSDELYLIRDRCGIKPLYFCLQGGRLSFASEIKALWELPWIEKKIKLEAISHYLTYLTTPAPMTLFQEIYKLPPAHYLKLDNQGSVQIVEWYTPIKSSIQAITFDDEKSCVEQLQKLLRNSVKQQMMSDVPLGVFLSGGIDSSLNVALMSEFTDKVNTFTIAFRDGPEYSELQWARQIAQKFNTNHHEIEISEQEAFDFFQKMIYYQDEPLGDCVCIPLYYVAKLAKDSGITVVQVGEGSDELFCGYSSYANYLNAYPWWHYSQRVIAQPIRNGIYHAARSLFPTHFNRLALLNNWSQNREFFWGGAIVCPQEWKEEFSKTTQQNFRDPIIEQCFPGFAQNNDSYAIADYHYKQLKKQNPNADYLCAMTYLELKNRLSELLLMRVDKMTMATSIEARVPFLDHHLVEFALQLPQNLKYRHGITKYILKKACEGILPHEIIYRKKIGFAAPIVRWFKEGRYFAPYFNELIMRNRSLLNNYFDTSKLEQLLLKNRTGKQDYSYQLWAVQNMMAALEQYI